MCLRHEEEACILKTKLSVIAYAEKMVNYVFEDLRKEKAPNSYREVYYFI
jgi:hypothetical protein